MSLALVALVAGAALLAAPAALAGTRTYKGKNYDVDPPHAFVGKYTVKVKSASKDGEKILKVRVTCSSKKKCKVLRKKKFKLFPAENDSWVGDFTLDGSACTIVALRDKQRFDSNFYCDNGLFATISGVR
ncbi:MAG: hypothetical protein ACQGVK_25005 [Myxococcota bacterium]